MHKDDQIEEYLEAVFPQTQFRKVDNSIRFNKPELNTTDINSLAGLVKYDTQIKRSGTGIVIILTLKE